MTMVIHFILDGLFHAVCGWLGAKLLYFVSAGRLDFDPLDSDLASWVGVGILIGIAVGIGWMLT